MQRSFEKLLFSIVLNLISSDLFLATFCLLSWFFSGYW